MKNTTNNLRLLTNLLVKRATYLGLSESNVQNMLTSALDSTSGVELRARYYKDIRRERRCLHYDKMPHHPLPNVSSFTNTPSKFGIIGALFGMLLREDEGLVKLSNWRNIRANNYVSYHMNFLGHLRDNKSLGKYWKEGFRLMNSPAFQLMAFNYVNTGWYKLLSVKQVNSILAGVSDIVAESRTEINLKRVYIEKANGKQRPLGVPSRSWRVYLHMLNVLIVWYRTGMDPNQHAYMPSKGVHTAWLSLLERMYEKNIYEFDLKSFFPSVNLAANTKILVDELGIPSTVADYIHSINKSLTKLADIDLLPEEADRNVLLNTGNSPNPNLPTDVQSLLKEVIFLWYKVWGNNSKSENQLQEMLQKLVPEGWSLYKENGVPQGAATSCGLATVSLHYIWQKLGDSLLMYADDGLVFPIIDSIDPDVSDQLRGIEVNKEKSGWIKKAGKWCKPLKFLGLELRPSEDSEEVSLYACTRSGSRVEFTLEKMLLIHLLNEKDILQWLLDERSDPNGIRFQPVTLTEESDSTDMDSQKLFIKDRGVQDRVQELLYSGQRIKSPSASKRLLGIKSKTLADLDQILSRNVSLKEWLEGALERFQRLENPLKLLFQGNGLATLASMYSGDNISGPLESCDIRCKKSSWAYNNLGSYLFNQLLDFDLSKDLRAKIDQTRLVFKNDLSKLTFTSKDPVIMGIYRQMIEYGSTTSSVVELLPTYDLVWRSLFCIPGKPSLKFEKDSLWGAIREEMKSFLRSLSVDIYNASTFACDDLLKNNLVLPTRKEVSIRFCLVNRVKPMEMESRTSDPNKRLVKQEKEFRRQFGVWPRKLRKIVGDP